MPQAGSRFTSAGTEGNIPSILMAGSEVHMYARVWKANILPGKVDEFSASINFVKPLLRRQSGFRGLLVLHTGPGDGLEATVLSVWSSIDDLRNSETPAFQEAVLNMLTFCERRPVMREEVVVMCEFSSDDPDSTITNF